MNSIIIFGIQGSGKGIQAKLLSARLGYQHIDIGDLLRYHISHHTAIGQQIQSAISRGELMPDVLIFQLIKSTLDKMAHGIVFDGFPRTLAQAEYLIKHFKVQMAFYLQLDEDKAIARIQNRRVCKSCGANYNLNSHKPQHDGICDRCGSELIVRMDDTPEAMAKRIQAFYQQTQGLMGYFENHGLLRVIDADKTPEAISDSLLEALGKA